MDIGAKEIAFKKKIGHLDGSPVYDVATIGGLHLVVGTKNGKSEVLGCGPHRSVARHIAKKHAPEMIISELSKSDAVEVEHFEVVLPRYEALTDQLRKR